MGVDGQRHSPAALLPEKTPYPLYRRLGGPQGRSGQVRKISPPAGNRSPYRPAHSESLCWLRYPGPWPDSIRSVVLESFPISAYTQPHPLWNLALYRTDHHLDHNTCPDSEMKKPKALQLCCSLYQNVSTVHMFLLSAFLTHTWPGRLLGGGVKLLLTYSMVQIPSWEANWFAASQEIPRISRNPKVHYRTHKRPPPVSILGQPNPVHIPTFHLLEIRPNIIHPSTPRSPQWSLLKLLLEINIGLNFWAPWVSPKCSNVAQYSALICLRGSEGFPEYLTR